MNHSMSPLVPVSGSAVSGGHCNRSPSINSIGFLNSSLLRGRSLSSWATQSRSSRCGCSGRCLLGSTAGSGALMTRDRKQYDIETKLLIVRRHLQGVSGRVLAKEYDLPSPGTLTNWTRMYRRDGEDGLRPKKRGRPPVNRENPVPESEVVQLRRENERLRAEVAYLGKLRALRAQERR
ncbi:MAG: helix-turn-helix domain-containing protein [Arthrobacter sp.]